ncbi:MAG TPA: DUF6067 family protein [Planctomycetota bacterium]|nr:DUF6067 family protein [Planctomycetota bacterium]HRR81229.1 DUF6067 family protein [Planctomycetota bacterium]HRT93540.1 DUF6067 family protein [Planctomycetota bacterium]
MARWAVWVALASPLAMADTVTLQQGVGGYEGCKTTTLWGATAKKPTPESPEALYLRGIENQLYLTFELPKALAAKKLARARLEVFVPSVQKLRMICEIACRELRSEPVPAPAERGQPAGQLDSYSLWEFNGQWFPHKYRFLGLPEGGKWIDFNVTAAARERLKEAAPRVGFALQPLALPDKRMPNTAEIDIPSDKAPDASKRPRLVLDFEPLDKPYLVGMTHCLEKFCDRDTRYRFFGPFNESYEMAMARNEFEGLQVLVYPMNGALEGVTLDWSDLADPKSGARIPRSDIACFRQEVFRLHPNGKIRDWYFHGKNFDVPDPLVTLAPADLPEHMSTPYWFTIRTRPDTRAGNYAGTITVKPRNAPPRELKLAVKVWDYKIPEVWNFETMGQTIWGNIARAHGKLTPELKRKYLDFLLDHRFSPVEQYADVLSPNLEDIPYCIQRGMSTIYLSGNFRVSDQNVESLKKRYDAVQKLGLIDKALVYIGDETKDWAEMRRRSDAIRKACPELMIMIGGSFPRPELEGIIDIFDPQIDVGKGNQVYSVNAEDIQPLIAKAQGRGEKFFWYVAAGPMLPCPNVQMEEPLIAARVLFWLTWKFGVTGFEYYCYNIWTHNFPDKDGRRWPDKPFHPRGWGDTNGDGMLFYPGPDGPFSSVRFENIRDGIEDWESHYVLRDYAEALRASDKANPLLARADALLKVPDEVTKMDFVSWTWEPEVLLKAHRELGDTIEALAKLIPEEEMLKVRAARKKAELERQRAMLRARAQAAK